MPTMYAVLPLVLLLTLAAMLGPAWLIGREQHESATGARTSSSPSSCPVVGCTGGLDCVSQLLGRPCRMADTMPFPAVPARLWSETQAIAAQAERDHAAALAHADGPFRSLRGGRADHANHQNVIGHRGPPRRARPAVARCS